MGIRLIVAGLIAAVLACAQSSEPEPSSFDCAADGTVVNVATNEPILRAHVELTIAGAVYSAVTDASGSWALSNLGCGTARLTASRPGFMPGSKRVRPFQLASGATVHILRTELVPESVIIGRVIDDNGDPVTRVQIFAFAWRVVEGRFRFRSAGGVRANDLGEYRFPDLEAGKYIVCARPSGGPSQTASKTIAVGSCAPGPLDGGAEGAMKLAMGTEKKVDLAVHEVPAVHIRGAISGPDTRGVPDARGAGVSLTRVDADVRGNNVNMPGGVRDGKFDFRAPPGRYLLRGDYFFDNGARLFAVMPIEVGSSDIGNLDLRLDAGFSVKGTVRVERAAQLADEPVMPEFGISLRLTQPLNGTAQRIKWTDGRTSFEISGLLAGNYRLDAIPPLPYYVKSATLSGQDILNTDVPISQAAGPLEIVVSDDGGSIDGDVADVGGHPVTSAILLTRGTVRVAMHAANANGRFRMQNVPPGEYTIYAWDDLSNVPYADGEWMRRNAPEGMAVTVTAGRSVHVKLTQQLAPEE